MPSMHLSPGAFLWRAGLTYLPTWLAVAMIGFLPVTMSGSGDSSEVSVPVESTFVVEAVPTEDAVETDVAPAVSLPDTVVRSDAYQPESLSYRPGRLVMDHAQMLDWDDIHRMDSVLALVLEAEGLEVGMLTIPALPPGAKSLEDYSLAVARTWGLGTRTGNRGVLLLVVRDDRKIRIETTEEIRELISDAECEEIIAGIMVLRMREGRPGEAIVDGLNGVLWEVATRFSVPGGSVAPPPVETDSVVDAGPRTHPWHAFGLALLIAVQIWVGWRFYVQKQRWWILVLPLAVLAMGAFSMILGIVAGISCLFNFSLLMPMLDDLEADGSGFGWILDMAMNMRSSSSSTRSWGSSRSSGSSSSSPSSSSSSRSSSSGGGFRGGGGSGGW